MDSGRLNIKIKKIVPPVKDKLANLSDQQLKEREKAIARAKKRYQKNKELIALNNRELLYCEPCNKYITRGSMYRHRQGKIHCKNAGIKKPEEDQKWRCEICDKTLSQSSQKYHLTSRKHLKLALIKAENEKRLDESEQGSI